MASDAEEAFGSAGLDEEVCNVGSATFGGFSVDADVKR